MKAAPNPNLVAPATPVRRCTTNYWQFSWANLLTGKRFRMTQHLYMKAAEVARRSRGSVRRSDYNQRYQGSPI